MFNSWRSWWWSILSMIDCTGSFTLPKSVETFVSCTITLKNVELWNYGGTSMQHNEATSMYINTSEGRKGEYDKTSNQNIHKTRHGLTHQFYCSWYDGRLLRNATLPLVLASLSIHDVLDHECPANNLPLNCATRQTFWPPVSSLLVQLLVATTSLALSPTLVYHQLYLSVPAIQKYVEDTIEQDPPWFFPVRWRRRFIVWSWTRCVAPCWIRRMQSPFIQVQNPSLKSPTLRSV